MPASIARMATSVGAAPSVGSSTIASTLSLMKVSIWLICRLASFVPSAARKSMSSYFSASASAAALIAASQPWSACGPENPMTTVSPGSSFELPALAAAVESPLSLDSGSLLVHATSIVLAASSAPLVMRIRRSGLEACRDMTYSLVWVLGLFRDRGRCVQVGREFGGWRCGVVAAPPWSWSGVLSGDPLLQQDGGDDDRALGNVLVRRVQVVQGENVGQ